MSAVPRIRSTAAEYLAWDATHDGKHAFVNGENHRPRPGCAPHVR